ncbi:hypothetical protein CEXT_544821, partial [Caerostris extrusa]
IIKYRICARNKIVEVHINAEKAAFLFCIRSPFLIPLTDVHSISLFIQTPSGEGSFTKEPLTTGEDYGQWASVLCVI